MKPDEVLATVIRPTLARMGPQYEGPEAEVLMLSIQRQEDPGCTRCQVGGPARGLWQMEPNGVFGVLAHDRTAHEAYRVAVAEGLGDDPDWHAITADMERDDRLACVFARLLLWTLPDPLPRLGESGVAWAQYVKAWRPGRPRPLDWPHNYAAALAALWLLLETEETT